MANYGIDEPIPDYFQTSLPTPAGNVGQSSFASNLGGLLFAGGDSGLSDYLTREQQKQMQRQALMQAAMSLLKSGRTSTTPIGLGEALGSAYEAGTAGYQGAQTNAIQQLLTKQKMDEYKRQVASEEAYQNMFAQMPTAGAPMTPQQVLSVGGGQAGPTVQRAAMIGMPATAGATTGGLSALTQMQRDILQRMPAKEGRAELLKMIQTPEITGAAFKAQDGNFYYPTKQGPIPASIAPAAKAIGQPQQVMGTNGKPMLIQMYDDDTYRPVTGFSPLIPPEKIDTGGGVRFVDPYAIKPGTVFPKTMPPQVVGSAEGGYFVVGGGGGGGGGAPSAPQAAPSVSSRRGPPMPGAAVAPAAAGPQPIIPGTGKAFANEKDLRTEFSTQVKPYTELAQAFRKVEAAALNPSAAGDISLVYGYMKILDPGSTVMQGEQATAQNAGSVPDSVRAMYNKALTGESLAPNIRQDFYAQARNIIESQRELSSDLMQRYTNVAREYKLNPNQIVYDPFKRIKTPAEVAAEAVKNQNKPKTNRTYTNQYGLTPRSN
jgi:hypothetical protein